MKKLFLVSSIAFTLMNVTQVVYADMETPLPPTLKAPANFGKLSKEKLSFFEWTAPSNLVSAAVDSYRFIITTNSAFSDYNQNKKICSKTTCFTTSVDVGSTKLALTPSLKTFLKPGKDYFWKVQAVNKSHVSLFSGNKFKFSLNDTLLKISNVKVTPKSAVSGSEFTFSSTLNANLPDGYSVQVDYGEGFKKMTILGTTAVNFVYSTVIKNIDPKLVVKSFEISLFDKNNVKVTGSEFTGSYSVSVSSTPPVIDKVNVSPNNIKDGESLTFWANLNTALISGTVKVDYGEGLRTMTQSDKTAVNFAYTAKPSLSQSVTSSTSRLYSIGIYDDNNLIGDKQTGNFTIVPPLPPSAPTLNFISGDTTATIGVPYTIKFSANDKDGNLGFIQILDWGDGASDSQNTTNDTPLSFSHTFTALGSFIWKAIAYDSTGAASSVVTKNVTVSEAKIVGYTKIANNGSVVGDSAKLGTTPTDWACTKDNQTGLMWEVKVDDGGLRDKDWYYSWYEPDASKNGGFEGYKNYYPKGCKSSECDTHAYVEAVNKQGLCGATDWRMPTKTELMKLVLCSDGKYDEDDGECTNYNSVTRPAIDKTFFPNTKNVFFWTNTFHADYSDYAWIVDFNDGNDSNGYALESKNYSVRLVSGQ